MDYLGLSVQSKEDPESVSSRAGDSKKDGGSNKNSGAPKEDLKYRSRFDFSEMDEPLPLLQAGSY